MAWPTRWPDGIISGELVTAAWLTDVSTSLAHLERVASASNTTSVTINTTTAATSVLLVSAGAVTFEAIEYEIRVECGSIQRLETATGGPSCFIGLYDNGTAIRSKKVHLQAGGTGGHGGSGSFTHRLTPSAAPHTYQARAYANTADDWIANASATAGDNYGPITIDIYRVIPA